MILIIHISVCLWMMSSDYVFMMELVPFVTYFKAFFKVTDDHEWVWKHTDKETLEELQIDEETNKFI